MLAGGGPREDAPEAAWTGEHRDEVCSKRIVRRWQSPSRCQVIVKSGGVAAEPGESVARDNVVAASPRRSRSTVPRALRAAPGPRRPLRCGITTGLMGRDPPAGFSVGQVRRVG
jgi:hypothetical protein